MAKENDDDMVVQLDDSDTISVNLEDDQTTVTAPEPVIKKETKPKPVKRVSPDDQQVVHSGPTPEEALAQAQAFGKQQEDARRAAEATAANERAMREQAQREAQQAAQEAQQYQERATNSELVLIDRGIESANREIAAYEEEFTRAAEAGEFKKMGEVQKKLSKAAARLDRLESEKEVFEQNVKRSPTTEGRVTAPEPAPNVSERYLSQFSPVAQNWLRQHPECWPAEYGGSSQKNSKMMAGHYDAIAQNLTLNSPEYFRVIEEHVNPSTAAPVVRDQQVSSKAAEIQVAGETTTPRPRAVQPSAPVSREAPSTSGQPRTVREVRLTKEQQEMAKVSFPHLSEQQAFGQYARNLIELQEEGKIGRTSH